VAIYIKFVQIFVLCEDQSLLSLTIPSAQMIANIQMEVTFSIFLILINYILVLIFCCLNKDIDEE